FAEGQTVLAIDRGERFRQAGREAVEFLGWQGGELVALAAGTAQGLVAFEPGAELGELRAESLLLARELGDEPRPGLFDLRCDPGLFGLRLAERRLGGGKLGKSGLLAGKGLLGFFSEPPGGLHETT